MLVLKSENIEELGLLPKPPSPAFQWVFLPVTSDHWVLKGVLGIMNFACLLPSPVLTIAKRHYPSKVKTVVACVT